MMIANEGGLFGFLRCDIETCTRTGGKVMRRKIAVVLLFVMAVCFTACSAKKESSVSSEADSERQQDVLKKIDAEEVISDSGDKKKAAADISVVPDSEVGRIVGNSPANILQGGYFAKYGDGLFYICNDDIYKLDAAGQNSLIYDYDGEKSIAYLNIYNNYIYYMEGMYLSPTTKAYSRDGNEIYRIDINGTQPPELVVSNVSNIDGTGFYIRHNLLFYNSTGQVSPDKTERCAIRYDLESGKIVRQEPGCMYFGVSENAYYETYENGYTYCEYEDWDGESGSYLIFRSFDPEVNNEVDWKMNLPIFYPISCAFTIDGPCFYYLDYDNYDSTYIIRLSPDGAEKYIDLGALGYECARGLYISGGEMAMNLAVFGRTALGARTSATFFADTVFAKDGECCPIGDVPEYESIYVDPDAPDLFVYINRDNIYYRNNGNESDRALSCYGMNEICGTVAMGSDTVHTIKAGDCFFFNMGYIIPYYFSDSDSPSLEDPDGYEPPTEYDCSLITNIADITASSVLPDSVPHPASNLNDGQYNTCWCEAKDDTGIGETVTWIFESPVVLMRMHMYNGYLSKATTYTKNGYIKDFRLDFYDEYGNEYQAYEATCPDLSFEDALNGTEFDFSDSPVTGVKKVVLTILSAEAGTIYSDTCVSEVEFYGDEDY